MGWWGILIFLASTFVVAIWAILSDAWALGASVVATLLVAALLLSYGRARITVDGSGLRAGGATIDWQWVRGAKSLDAEASRLAISAAADGHSWLLIRPYLKTGVRVDLNDPADPRKQWVLASRRPRELALAINSQVAARRAALSEGAASA